MIVDGNHLIAEEGKWIRRIVSDELFGEDYYMGYAYYIGGVLQDPPHEDVVEDFDEVPIPELDEDDAEI